MLLSSKEGPELLALFRKSSFDDEIDQQISSQVGKLVEQIKLQEKPASPPPKQDTKLLDRLWVIKNAYIEILTLQEMGELSQSLEAIDKLKTANRDFGDMYPGSIVVNDISENLDTVKDQIYKQVSSLWQEQISVTKTDSSVTLKISPQFQNNWDLFRQCELRLQNIEAFLTKFHDMIEYLVKLQVDDVGETDHSVSLGLGETKSIEMLIYNVQTFILALSSVVPHSLYQVITARFGQSYIRDLVSKALPALSPSNPAQLDTYKSEIQGCKGLEELLVSVEWFHGHILSDYADNFNTIWVAQREAVYLDQLRTSLKGKYQTDSWDWDGEEDEEPQEEEEQEEREPPAAIIGTFAHETDAGIDNLLILYRALAPKYYGDHIVELYAATRDLHAQVNQLKYSADAYSRLESFGAMQLDLAIENFSVGIDKIVHQPPSSSTASKLSRQMEQVAQKSSAAGPMVRDNILNTLCEQVCAYTIRSTLSLGDITQDQGEQLSQFIKGLRGLGAFFNDINDQVPSWIKMQRLEQVLNQNLVGIRGMYENSMLADFTGDELVRLVEALFVDSDAREEIIQLVSQ